MSIKALCFLMAVLIIADARASDEAEQGRALIKAASSKTNIFELPLFRLTASVRIDNFGTPLDGTYSLLWNGPEQWREEVLFPGYSEVQVGNKGMVYISRNLDHIPYRVFQLRSALGFDWKPNPGPWYGERIKKIRHEKIDKRRVTCIQILGNKFERDVCIDDTTNLLDRSKEGLHESEVLPVGVKLFPRTISLNDTHKDVVEIHIATLDNAAPLSSLEPPSGAVSRRGCMNALPPRVISVATPSYPIEHISGSQQGTGPAGTVGAEPRMVETDVASRSGTVGVYALIDENGVPQNLHISLAADSILNKASIDALRKWRYAPATCNGTPVSAEVVVTMKY